MEGIMMKGPKKYSIAVRKPDGNIDVQVYNNKRTKFSKVPVLRGIFNFFDSLYVGYKSLMSSAEISMGTEYEEDKLEIWLKEHFGEKSGRIITTAAGMLGSVLALVLFMILPTAITGIIDKLLPLGSLKALVEGVTKLGIFIIYIWGISIIPDIKRLFRYHGAEHKTIACFESGEELTVENVRKHTRFHPRCGTSFMFIILLVSIAVFSFVPWKGTLSRSLMKVIFLPLVVGISYEILKYTGTRKNFLTKIMVCPGLWFQNFTTREPDDSMIEVAIASLKAVLPREYKHDNAENSEKM